MMPRSSEEEVDLPSTLEKSDKHAQEIYKKAHDSALETYHVEEARAHRVAYAALKHEYEKQGDRWVRKPESAHPSSGRTMAGQNRQRRSR